MAKTAAFHGRILAGIDCKLKMVIHVFTEWAPQGFQGEARRYVAPWVLSPPRRQKANQTPVFAVEYITVNASTLRAAVVHGR